MFYLQNYFVKITLHSSEQTQLSHCALNFKYHFTDIAGRDAKVVSQVEGAAPLIPYKDALDHMLQGNLNQYMVGIIICIVIVSMKHIL